MKRLNAIGQTADTQFSVRHWTWRSPPSGSKYSFVMSRTDSMKVDETALKKAGLFDQYAVPKTTYTLRVKMKEEETK